MEKKTMIYRISSCIAKSHVSNHALIGSFFAGNREYRRRRNIEGMNLEVSRKGLELFKVKY